MGGGYPSLALKVSATVDVFYHLGVGSFDIRGWPIVVSDWRFPPPLVAFFFTLGLTVSATVDGFASPRLWHAIRVFHTVVFPQPAGPRIMTLAKGYAVDGGRRVVDVDIM